MGEDFGINNSLLDYSNPNTYLGLTQDLTSNATTNLSDLGSSLFDNIGGLQGIGGLIGTIGSIWGGIEQRKYQDKLLKMEKERISRDRARQDKFDNGMQQAWS